MILDLDRTSLKYAPCSRKTLARKNSKHVAISATSNKKATTRTFVITLDGQCLPFQAIYGSKTMRNLPKFKNPKEFSLSVNEKHFSNTQESLKNLKTNFDSIRKSTTAGKKLSLDHPAMLILEIFVVYSMKS